MSDLERLNIILAARDREFASAMERNQRRVERFAQRSQRDLSKTSKSFDAMAFASKRLAPVMAALGAAAVVGKLKNTVSTLDDIGKTADKMGLTTDALQELRTVAEGAGVSQSSLDSSMERFNKRLGEAANGTGAASKELKRLGLEAADLATMGLDDALSQVADKIAAMADPTERAASAAALFGREGVAMVNLLREGSAGMAEMRREARDLGIIIDEKMIRSAEEAQTKLDLMGRVISAQLNSALIELAPLLVGGATAVADLARGLNSGIQAVQNFLHPQSNLQLALDNVVAAMADEIRQSQLLDTALANGITMSQSTARAKLEEARTRHENAKAALAEHKALVLNSDEWANMSAQISDAQSALMSSGFHGDKATAIKADAYEQEQARLAALIVARQDLIKADKEMEAQLARTGANVATLESAIGQSGGGLVNVQGNAVNPIEAGARKEITGTGSAAGAAVPDLTNYAQVMERIKGVFGEASQAGGDYRATLAEVQALYEAGQLSGEEYADAVAAVEGRFSDAKAASENLKSSVGQTFASIVTGAESASDAVSNLLGNLAGQFANAAFGGLFKNSTIFDGVSSLLSFDGGGYTGSAPRSGGLDGKGGQLAMLHPRETVIDHTKGQSAPASGGGRMQINVNVSGARGNSEIMEMVQSGVSAGIRENNRSVMPGLVQQINADPRRVG